MSPRRGARGFGLIIAVGVTMLLSMLGLLVLDQAYNLTQHAGSRRAAQNALYIAEAGAVWGRFQLEALLFGAGTVANPANLQALPPMPAYDDICPENLCGDGLCPPPISCAAFLRLTPVVDPAFAGGSYRVAVRCNPSCSAASPTYTVRALGMAQEGGPGLLPRRLVEQTVGP